MDKDIVTSSTPGTAERVKWILNDIRYKAPEQVFGCQELYINLLIQDCETLEKELIAANAKLAEQ